MPAPFCRGPVDRREFLRAGALALGGLTLADVQRARAEKGTSAETSVIFLHLLGGASHLETYDLKPAAPVEYRSVFKPIATNVSGIQICEHLPLQARLADRFALVRSCHHTMSAHNDGSIEILTGKTPERPDATSTSIGDHPDFGSISSWMRGEHGGLPHYVGIPSRPHMTRPTYVGAQHAAFSTGDPAMPGFAPPGTRLRGTNDLKRLDDRRGLRDHFDRLRSDIDRSGTMEGADRFRESAFQLLTGPDAARAFDLTRESDKLRDRYGRHTWGQGCLLARRLAEAGVAVITLTINTPKNGPEFTNWDDHIMNAMRPGHFGDYMKTRLPYFDQALSALIEDVYARALDRRVMVVAMGEFGRTPRLSSNAQGTGRDHWPDAQSVLLSGGGLRTGQVVGATNSRGEFPAQRPCTPKDILATIYRHLGIDFKHSFTDPSGRPVPVLGECEPMAELI